MFNDKKPLIDHLKLFGCKCFVLNNGKNDLGNFNVWSNESTSMGYSSTSKLYWVFNKITHYVKECVHVKFEEFRKEDDNIDDRWVEELTEAKEITQEVEEFIQKLLKDLALCIFFQILVIIL